MPVSSYSPLLMIKVEKTPDRNTMNSEKPPLWSIGNVILWNSKKYVVTFFCENKNFFNFVKPKHFAKIAETCCFNYAFLLSDPVQAFSAEACNCTCTHPHMRKSV